MEDLFHDNMKLAGSRAVILHKFYCGKLDMSLPFEDILQEAYLGLYKASLKYDPGKNTKFSTYAVRYIDGYIQKFIFSKCFMIKGQRLDNATKDQRQKSVNETVFMNKIMSFDEPVRTDIGETDDLMLGDVLESRSISYDEIDEKIWLTGEMQRILDRREIFLLYHHYVFGESQTSLAKKLQVSQTTINNIIKAAKRKLRENLVA